MFREYKAGRTPNPDAMCNKYVKFNAFLKKALKEGADLIATGHYVRRGFRVEGLGSRKKYTLYQAKDKSKDQSYFLYTLTQEQLQHCLFPLGDYLKSDVRKMAKKWGLPQWDKKDSQGICFVGKIPMKEYLQTKIPAKPGTLMTLDGKIVGEHQGAAYYTIGQRHGLGFGGGDDPYYVVSKDMKKNIVFVAKNDASALYKKEVDISDMHWVSETEISKPLTCKARIRYRQPLQSCTVWNAKKKGRYYAIFIKKQRAVTPGQAIVLYKGQEMLGGGIIL